MTIFSLDSANLEVSIFVNILQLNIINSQDNFDTNLEHWPKQSFSKIFEQNKLQSENIDDLITNFEFTLPLLMINFIF